MKIVFALALLALGGCATTKDVAVADTFCLSATKIKWSTADTPETIQAAETHNRTIDKRCYMKGKTS